MHLALGQIGALALATLTDEERAQSAVYLDPTIHPPSSTIVIGRENVQVSQPTVVVFVDLMPAANWGHACRYLLVNAESGAVQGRAAQFPPPRAGLRLMHRAAGIEDWMLLTVAPVA